MAYVSQYSGFSSVLDRPRTHVKSAVIKIKYIFDTVDHNYLWEALNVHGVNKKIIKILMESHRQEKLLKSWSNQTGDTQAYVKMDKPGPATT